MLLSSRSFAFSNDAFNEEGRKNIVIKEADLSFKAISGQESSLSNVTAAVKDSGSSSRTAAAINVLKVRHSSDEDYEKLINECIEKNQKNANVLYECADALYVVNPEAGMRVWERIIEQEDAALRYRLLAVKKIFVLDDKYRADSIVAAGILSSDAFVKKQAINLCEKYGTRIDKNVIAERIRVAKPADEIEVLDLLNDIFNFPVVPKTE